MLFVLGSNRRRLRRLGIASGLMLAAGIALWAGAARAQTSEVTIAGPTGTLAGTQLDAGKDAPLLLLIPASGPTDRDGNNRLATAGSPYRQLAEALAAKGVATLRIDKRGMFGSRVAATDPASATIGTYSDDVRAWVADARKRTGRACVWVGGHSEGGLVALAAVQKPDGMCGVVLLAAPGRPLGAIMREQFRANPANAPILESALAMLDAFEGGRRVDATTLPAPLARVFPDRVQDFLIDAMRYDPAALAAKSRLPMLVVGGDRDIQVRVADVDRLAGAGAHVARAMIPGMTHVLRIAAGDTPAASLATYADASLPVAPALVDTVAGFVLRQAPR